MKSYRVLVRERNDNALQIQDWLIAEARKFLRKYPKKVSAFASGCGWGCAFLDPEGKVVHPFPAKFQKVVDRFDEVEIAYPNVRFTAEGPEEPL